LGTQAIVSAIFQGTKCRGIFVLKIAFAFVRAIDARAGAAACQHESTGQHQGYQAQRYEFAFLHGKASLQCVALSDAGQRFNLPH
jgi:hypothetical protein